jgi:hypothetical protein
MNPAPVLRLRGVVHTEPVLNPVAPAEAVEAQRDENGRVVKQGYPARDGYDKYDVTVLTEDGGFVTLVMRDEAIAAAEGYLPSKGDEVDLPVYGYVAYRGNPGRRFAVVGFSFAGTVYAAQKASEGGKRAHLASTGT